jgi:hypothetical protein
MSARVGRRHRVYNPIKCDRLVWRLTAQGCQALGLPGARPRAPTGTGAVGATQRDEFQILESAVPAMNLLQQW